MDSILIIPELDTFKSIWNKYSKDSIPNISIYSNAS